MGHGETFEKQNNKKKIHDNEYNEIMMELAQIRTELEEMRTRVVKIHRYIQWQRAGAWVKRILILLIFLGFLSVIQQYFPAIVEKMKYINDQFLQFQQLQNQVKVRPASTVR